MFGFRTSIKCSAEWYQDNNDCFNNSKQKSNDFTTQVAEAIITEIDSLYNLRSQTYNFVFKIAIWQNSILFLGFWFRRSDQHTDDEMMC